MLAILWLLSTQFFTTSWISSLIGRIFGGGEERDRNVRVEKRIIRPLFLIPILSALQNVHKAASYAGNSIPAAIRGQYWALRRIHQKYNTLSGFCHFFFNFCYFIHFLIYPWVSHLVHVPLAIQQSKDCSRQWIQTWGCFSHMICSNQVNFLSERTTWKTHTPISVRWYLHHQVSIDYCTYQTKIYCNRLQRGNLSQKILARANF